MRRPAQRRSARASRAGSVEIALLDDRARVAQAEQRDVLAEDLDLAAVEDLLQVADRDPQDLLGDRLLGLVQPRRDRLIDELALDRVLRVEDQLDRRVADAVVDEALDLEGRSDGMITAASASPLRTLATASSATAP